MELESNTPVRMADWSQIRISRIRVGDLICNAQGRPSRVTNVITGMEEESVTITTEDDKGLHMTKNSIIETERGLLFAKELELTDSVFMEEGYRKLKKIETKEECIQVYLLETENSPERYIAGDGFIAGDMRWYMEMSAKKYRNE